MSDITPIKRISVEKGDVGERILASLYEARKTVKIFLDDIEQRLVLTADADEGFVKRLTTKCEIEAGHWPMEIARGKVRIEILDKPKASDHQS